MRIFLLVGVLISGTASANPAVAPPELKTYLNSEKFVATISPTDATFVATFTFRSDEDFSRVSSLRVADYVTVDLPIWLPEGQHSAPLLRRFSPYNDGRVPLIFENRTYREPIDTTIGLKVASESPETIPLFENSYIHVAQWRRDYSKEMAEKLFLEPGFYRVVARFLMFPSVVKNQSPITFCYRCPLARHNGDGIFYYVPFFKNLPEGVSTSDTNRYAITIQATPDCSVTVNSGGQNFGVAGGSKVTLAPKANEPIRAISRSAQGKSSTTDFEASSELALHRATVAALIQSHVDTLEGLTNNTLKLVLYATQFPSGTLDTVQNCHIRANGRGTEDLHASRRGAGHGIANAGVQELINAIGRLPDKSDQPDLRNLVILSYSRDGSSWRTSTYDISHAPDELKQVFDACRCHLGPDTNLEERIRE
jgi:hypothetical protein